MDASYVWPESNPTTWTCFCCDGKARQSEEMPDRCASCGGVWVRPIEVSTWAQIKHRIRSRFTRSHTFDSADELIEWLSNAPDVDEPESDSTTPNGPFGI